MTKKEQIAKVIRILSVPPVMITALVLLLYFFRNEYFHNPSEMVISIILLGIVPVLAYPLHKVFGKKDDNGRDGQRKLAFITNLIGYTLAFIWAIVSHVQTGLFILCSTYFFSVLILTVCNKLHFKASGHASSFTGPLLMLVYSFGFKVIIPCVIVAALIWWSSIVLKRHTAKQLLGGMIVCAASFGIAILLAQII